MPIQPQQSDESGTVSITESISNSPALAPVGNTFVLGRSRVNHKQIQDFVNKGYLDPDSLGRSFFRPPSNEIVPQPKPYEAVVFRDFFAAGLHFPLEPFVSEVLDLFEVQLHQLTPNAIARLSVFTMAMKMTGSELLVDTFARFYKIQQHRNKIRNPDTGEEVYSDFGAYIFVLKKLEDEEGLVPTFRNKWPQWVQYWFYHHVCADSEVANAQANGQEKALPLVSTLTPLSAVRTPVFLASQPNEIASGEAFLLTSRWQISRDLVKEWIALGLKPL